MERHVIINIGRQYGSGGTSVAEFLKSRDNGSDGKGFFEHVTRFLGGIGKTCDVALCGFDCRPDVVLACDDDLCGCHGVSSL